MCLQQRGKADVMWSGETQVFFSQLNEMVTCELKALHTVCLCIVVTLWPCVLFSC